MCLTTDALLWTELGVNGRWLVQVLCGVSGRETEKCVRGVAYLSPEEPVVSLPWIGLKYLVWIAGVAGKRTFTELSWPAV